MNPAVGYCQLNPSPNFIPTYNSNYQEPNAGYEIIFWKHETNEIFGWAELLVSYVAANKINASEKT